MMPDPTPEQQAREDLAMEGVLPVTIDGVKLELPILKRGAARRWRKLTTDKFASLMGVQADTPEGNEAMADAQLALILEYDTGHVLGDREWLDEHITDAEQDRLYNAIIEASFRFVSSPTALVLAIAQSVAASVRANSMNGLSSTGTSPAKNLTSGTRTPKSRSSGAARKSG
jgi:hypothetical protein